MRETSRSQEVRNEDGSRSWTETYNGVGFKEQRQVTATEWVETERDSCFCCSCYEDYYTGQMSTDPYCKNHGWVGTRRCEYHKLPGSGKCSADWLIEGETYKVDLIKLNTVQQENAKHREVTERQKEQYGD